MKSTILVVLIGLAGASSLADTAAECYTNGPRHNGTYDLAGAVTNFDRALVLQPDFAEAYFWRGGAKQGLGDLADALADYNQALAGKFPTALLLDVYYQRGVVKWTQGDLAGARDDFTHALTAEPDAAAFYSRANVAYQKKDWPAARRGVSKLRQCM